MSPRARRLAFAATLLLACAPFPSGAQAAGLRDNIATAQATADGTHISDFAWDVERQRGGAVDELNAAHATATCANCGATAIAFQIILASGSPSPVAPRNEAVAINTQCTNCVVAAEARQFVRVVEQPVRFTGAGIRELADVRRDLREIAQEALPVADLQAAVEREEARVRYVLANDLVLRSDASQDADVLRSRTLQDQDLG